MSIWRWSNLLPKVSDDFRITRGEGNTPVVRSERICPKMGLGECYFKLESVNPTGSYKDRFAAMAVSDMRQRNKQLCLATSSGNTGAALAAYCASAHIPCRLAIVDTAPEAKLAQMQFYGAELYRIAGFGSDPVISSNTFEYLVALGNEPDTMLQISAFRYSPIGMAGVQTIAYELAEQLHNIDHVFVPAGGGGLTLAIAEGFRQLVEAGQLSRVPRVHCVQPEGNDTMASALRDGSAKARHVSGTTQISGLQVPSVIDGDEVIEACRATGGTGHTVTDQQIYDSQQAMAKEEGLFAEPAGAGALAGLISAVINDEVQPTEVAVCLVSGSGFKDMASVDEAIEENTCPTIRADELSHYFRH